MKKQLIKLTEGDLHRIIKNTVNRVLRESFNDDEDLDAYAEERMDLEANYDDFPPTRNESIIRRAVKESINRILREDEEPYDWRSDFHLYHDSLNMKPEEGTALHDKYMKGAKEEFGDDELARIREFNRMWKERERRQGVESDSDDDFDDENEIKKALQRANYMKKMKPTKKQTYQEPQKPQTQRSLSDDELQARLKDLQAQGVLK